MNSLDLRELFTPILKWWWMVVISAVLAAGASYKITEPMPPIYSVSTTLVVGSSLYSPNPSAVEMEMGRRLAQSYAALAYRESIIQPALETLGLSKLPDFTVTAVENSPFIEISVVDINPERAQAVANELARQMVIQSPGSQEESDQSRSMFINEQLDSLQKDILSTQNEIAQKESEIGALDSAVEISEAQNQIAALNARLRILQTNYATLLSSTNQGAINKISVLEPAMLPTSPIGPNKKLILALAGVAGLVLGVGAAYWIEFLDDALKTEEDFSRLIPAPVLGYIGEMPKKSASMTAFLQPRSPAAEAFRNLRANLIFRSVDNPVRTLLVSSAEANEGKSTIVTNLGIIYAQAGKKVIVVDADFRHPALHDYLEVSNEKGLTEVIMGTTELKDALIPWQENLLYVLPAGNVPPNPTELLGSMRMNQTLSDLMKVADMVIINSAPFIVTDAMLLAAQVDGVLLVARPGYTRKATLMGMKRQIEGVGARILGFVFNRVQKTSSYSRYYSGYMASSYYYGSSNGKKNRFLELFSHAKNSNNNKNNKKEIEAAPEKKQANLDEEK